MIREVLASFGEKRVEVKDVTDRLKKSAEIGEKMMTLAGIKSEMRRKEREIGEGENEGYR